MVAKLSALGFLNVEFLKKINAEVIGFWVTENIWVKMTYIGGKKLKQSDSHSCRDQAQVKFSTEFMKLETAQT